MSRATTLIRGEALEEMAKLDDGCIDMVLADPPYGYTDCTWDVVIPFEPMWEQLNRVTRPGAAIVLTAGQPFTSKLIMSNLGMYRYCWVWDKVNRVTGFLNAKKRPLKRAEDVVVFYSERPVYNPQMTPGKPYISNLGMKDWPSDNYGPHRGVVGINGGERYPVDILAIKADLGSAGKIHPTQKPVELMEYMIKTYTNVGDTVLDFVMGSGTTGVAARNLGRKFIGIERELKYYMMTWARLEGTP